MNLPSTPLALLLLLTFFSKTVFGQCNCAPLPPPSITETVVYANNTAEVEQAIDDASGTTTIFLNTGTYNVSSAVFFNIDKPNITIRSTSGNRDDVIIQGEGMAASGVGHGIYLNNDNITIADLTVRDVQNHGFFVNPGVDNCLFHNVRGLDCGEQIFKASGDASLPVKNDGIIECSTFEYTTTLDDGDDGWYTNGIDVLHCHNWIIRDNIIKNIKHNPAITSNLAGPAILVWKSSANTIVERNTIIECDFGISFGNAGEGGLSHTGGIIRNNFIRGYSNSDFGIGLVYASDAKVINNTIYSPGGWGHSIEARFAETTNCLIMNNFVDENIWDDRNGASCTLTTNVTSAAAADFVSDATGDLHLSSNIASVVDAGTSSVDRTEDIDCGAVVATPDIGADEYQSVLPVEELVQLHAFSETNAVILKWATANEINNSGFEIQRSHDARNWSKIGWLNGQGSNVDGKFYRFIDKSPLAGVNYYRFKQIDFDGRFDYSNIVYASFEKTRIQLFPNPATETITIKSSAKTEIKALIIYNSTGQKVLQTQKVSNAIDIANLSKGFYVLEIELGNRKIRKRLIVE